MADNVIASVSVGLVIAVGFLLVSIGALIGWLIATRQKQQKVTYVNLQNDSLQPGFSQRLMRNLAHELRTPLTAILGHIEILNSCGYDEESLWRRSLSFVSSETERLARLVEDMLYLSRLNSAPLHLQAVNLRQTAEESFSIVCELAEKNNVSLVLLAPINLPRALADADRIRQVFINLLDNAIKYAPGSTTAISLKEEEDKLFVQVYDDGPGISADDIPHLLEPFYRSENTSARERGTGLGLTIVHTILVQHQSTLQVVSAPGQGASFAFSLPLDQ